MQGGPPSLITRTGTLKADASIGSEDDLGRISGREKEASRGDYTAKADSADNVFIEDVSAEITLQTNNKHPLFDTSPPCPCPRSLLRSTSTLAKHWFERAL